MTPQHPVTGREPSGTERLALSGAPVESEGVSFALVGGYQDALGPLYVDPDGKQIDSIGFDAVGAIQPGGTGFTIQPGVTVTATEVFLSAAPGGTFTFRGTLDDGNDTEVTVDIPISLTEG